MLHQVRSVAGDINGMNAKKLVGNLYRKSVQPCDRIWLSGAIVVGSWKIALIA
jgi:hypothetical protein